MREFPQTLVRRASPSGVCRRIAPRGPTLARLRASCDARNAITLQSASSVRHARHSSGTTALRAARHCHHRLLQVAPRYVYGVNKYYFLLGDLVRRGLGHELTAAQCPRLEVRPPLQC